MNNEPVAWMDYLEHSDVYDLNVSGRGIPLYTHPHPDNLGLALSIIDQQKLEIEALKAHPVKEQYKFGVDWSKDGNAVTVLKICEDGVAEVVFMDYQEATHPAKELNDGGEPVKNATYWKRQYNLMATQNDNLKSGLYHANEQIKYLESHPVKELTDEEILEVITMSHSWIDGYPKKYALDFARAILRKANEK